MKKANAHAKEASKKAKSKGFDDELVEKEKKLKKKDGDTAPVHHGKTDKPENHADKKEDKAEQPGPQDKKVVAADPKAAEHAKALQAQAALEAAAAAAGKAAPDAAAEALQAKQAKLVGEISAEEAALSELKSAELAKNLSGKINLEGFKMVEPQPVVAQTPVAPTDKAALEALKNLLANPAEAVKGKGDGNLKDLLSKHKEGGATQLGLGADILGAAAGAVKDNQSTSFANILKAQGPEGVENLRQSNVDNLVTSARTMIKDGGGQMQVVLNPDGLGTIDLKVGVDKGQVSVEINTQDKHVKKLFDDSINDIRHALQGHNLKVDTVKVGISDHFDNRHQMSQGQMDMMEREFARDFLGQFRDERQNFNNDRMMDRISNAPTPHSSSQPEGLKPASRIGTSSRLNVVG